MLWKTDKSQGIWLRLFEHFALNLISENSEQRINIILIVYIYPVLIVLQQSFEFS